VVADIVWYTTNKGEAELSICEFGIGIRGFGERKSEGSALYRLLLCMSAYCCPEEREYWELMMNSTQMLDLGSSCVVDL
jgi:hypothetical protein